LAQWIRSNPAANVPKVMTLVGFLPFGTAPFHLYMAAVSWPEWPGYVKGMEFSVLDAIALALCLGLPRNSQPLPFRLSMSFYFLAASAAVLQAAVPVAGLFYPWQLLRMFLLFSATSRACAWPRATIGLLTGMAAGLCMEAAVAGWGRLAHGALQASGTASHQNLLGLMSHFIVFPFFALVLSGSSGLFVIATMIAGIAVEVLTTSRATIGLAAGAYAGLFLISSLRQWTPHKAAILLGVSVLAAALTPLVLWSFNQRFAAEEQTNYDERAAFAAAASMMLSDHPLGVGPNSYVLTANVGGYNTRAGVAPTVGSSSANVHNIYWLVASETGYLGLATFILMLLCPVFTAFHCGLRNRGDQRGDLLLGIGVALLTVYVHSLFEWIFITFESQYMLAVELGMMVGVARQLGYWRLPPRYSVPVPGIAPLRNIQ
jgi:hypothetical protein